jgi:hypothetical protein
VPKEKRADSARAKKKLDATSAKRRSSGVVGREANGAIDSENRSVFNSG